MPGLVTPPPAPINARRVVVAGTLAWFVAFVVLLIGYRWLGEHDHRLWLWTALAGWVLGLLGLALMQRHRKAGRPL